jgi:hypothetical protein
MGLGVEIDCLLEEGASNVGVASDLHNNNDKNNEEMIRVHRCCHCI